ncbi:MAG: Na/Pi cotransporter family protein, partial [Bacteroidota bacterium]
LVATDKLTLRKAFPFLLGANIGTTATALLAALMATGAHPVAGLAIALCHVFFNLIGVLMLFPIRRIREIPIQLARRLGDATMHNRLVGIGYIAVTFFIFPFTLIIATNSRAIDQPPVTPTPQEQPLSESHTPEAEIDYGL